jgi:hypothetical protein
VGAPPLLHRQAEHDGTLDISLVHGGEKRGRIEGILQEVHDMHVGVDHQVSPRELRAAVAPTGASSEVIGLWCVSVE